MRNSAISQSRLMSNHAVLNKADFENITATTIPHGYAVEQGHADGNAGSHDVPLIQREWDFDLSLQIFSFVESIRSVHGDVSPFTLRQMSDDIRNDVKWMSGFCSVIRVGQGGVGFELGDLPFGDVESAYISVLRFICAQYRQDEDIPETFHFSKLCTANCFDIVYWYDRI